jgi:hypothetical protein
VRTLALFEAKKVLRNPLLWLGAALLGAFSWLNAREFWPLIPDDIGFAYQGVVVLAAFALLVGAWVGLRDRTSGAEGVLASTPLRQRGLVVPARMAALAASGCAVFLLVSGAVAAVSWARGGHGAPDAYLVADGALYVALAACTGFAIGHLTGSRIVSLLAAPLLPGAAFYLQGKMSGRLTDPVWALPNPQLPPRFGPLGYLPDVLPVHAAYLAAGVLGLVGIVWFVTGRRERAGSVRLPLAAAITGAAGFVACGAWLSVQPLQVYVVGPDASQQAPMTSSDDYRDFKRRSRAPGAYPDDGAASECARERGIEVCIYPEHGPEAARRLAAEASAVAPFVGLEGVHDTIRMVPATGYSYPPACSREDDYLLGSGRWNSDFWKYNSLARNVFLCAVNGPRLLTNRAADVLQAWFDVRVLFGRTGDEYVRAARRHRPGARGLETLLRMEPLSVEEVVRRIGPVWGEIRSDELTLDELDAALRR